MNAASIVVICLIAVSSPHHLLHAADEPGRSPAGPAQAVMPFVHAVRSNDAVALWELCIAASGTPELLGPADAPGPGRLIRERLDEVLAAVLAADAQDDLVARWLSWSAAVRRTATSAPPPPSADLPPAGLPPAWPGGPGDGPGGPEWAMVAGRGLASVLAQGLETQQIAAGKRLIAAAQGWASGVDVAAADQARIAVAALIAAVKDLGATTVAELAQQEQGELLARVGRALGHLKAATAAYGLDLDAVLDSLRIVDLIDLQPADGTKAVTIAFSAFGSEQRFPLKAGRAASGSWTVIADSSLGALLGERMPVMEVMLAMLAPPPGFPPAGPGGPGGRRANRDGPPGSVPPAPGNDGF